MRRAEALFYDHESEPLECDCCDEKKPCVHIHLGITNFVWCICKDCLNEFVYGFYSEQELRKLKLKKIDDI